LLLFKSFEYLPLTSIPKYSFESESSLSFKNQSFKIHRSVFVAYKLIVCSLCPTEQATPYVLISYLVEIHAAIVVLAFLKITQLISYKREKLQISSVSEVAKL